MTAGGGQLSTVVYHIRVDEGFKGAFDTIKGQRIVTLQMVRGAKRPPQAGPARCLPTFDDLPDLREGQDYLVLATVPGTAGSTTLARSSTSCSDRTPASWALPVPSGAIPPPAPSPRVSRS